VQEALKASLKALTVVAEEDDDWKAMALKIIGLAHERLGNVEEALAALNSALEINPKIGVKRKANAIRKRLKMKGLNF
jgi:tetratricopeptide (TPR) repeat protein